MNLVDLLAPKGPKPQPEVAETAETADSLQLQGLGSPPPLAESGGKDRPGPAIRQNPPPLAESKSRAPAGFPPNPPNPPPQTTILEKPLPVSLKFFTAQGVGLLPDDLAFLRWHLPKGCRARNAAIRQYLDTWRLASEREPLTHRRDNAGRRAANTWLSKHSKAHKGRGG